MKIQSIIIEKYFIEYDYNRVKFCIFALGII